VSSNDRIALSSTCPTGSTNGRCVLTWSVITQTCDDPSRTDERDKGSGVVGIGDLSALWVRLPLWGKIALLGLLLLLLLLPLSLIMRSRKRLREFQNQYNRERIIR